MPDEKFINDLFEAARQEPAARSLKSVTQFVQATGSGTSTSLIVQWLKQHKMNIFISTSGVIVATSILLFSKPEASEQNTLVETIQTPAERVELVETTETEPEPAEEATNEPANDAGVTSMEVEKEEETIVEEEASKEEVVKVSPSQDSSQAQMRLLVSSQDTEPASTSNEPKRAPVEIVSQEHMIVLESAKGRSSVKEFSEYLTNNLPQLKHEFTSTATDREIKKFTLKLDNGYKANFRMQVSGFEQLKLHWETSEDGEIKNVWYRLDDKELKELNFSKSTKSSVRVKFIHKDF
ncbi:MAG: hypothetical protein ABJG47_18625 [Ekhidna sp.]